MHIHMQRHSWTHTIKTTSKSIKQLKAIRPTEKHHQAKPPYHIMKNIQALTPSQAHTCFHSGAQNMHRVYSNFKTLIIYHDINSEKDLQTVNSDSFKETEDK